MPLACQIGFDSHHWCLYMYPHVLLSLQVAACREQISCTVPHAQLIRYTLGTAQLTRRIWNAAARWRDTTTVSPLGGGFCFSL